MAGLKNSQNCLSREGIIENSIIDIHNNINERYFNNHNINLLSWFIQLIIARDQNNLPCYFVLSNTSRTKFLMAPKNQDNNWRVLGVATDRNSRILKSVAINAEKYLYKKMELN